MKQIPLTKDKVALVDDEDYDFLMQWKWRFHGGYAVRTDWILGSRKEILMHRVIAKTPTSKETDHINGNKLDNRKGNLRVCSRSANRFNQGKYAGEHHSKYKGVTWHKVWKKWQAQIRINGKTKYLGKYDSETEAAIAYNNAAASHHKEFARLNEV